MVILIINSGCLYFYRLGMKEDEEEEEEIQFKVVFLGQSGVGKSTILFRYAHGFYNPQQPSLGIDCMFKKVTHAGQSLTLQLWDTAGQQRYRCIVSNYLRYSKAACVVFDLSNSDSLDFAKKWLQRLQQNCSKDIPKVLLGNKSDIFSSDELLQQLQRNNAKIEQLKREYKCEYFSVSAFSGEGIKQVFEYLVEQIYDQHIKEYNYNRKFKGYKKSVFTLKKDQLQGRESLRQMINRCCLNQ